MNFLIATVGGAPQPLVAAILAQNPLRVLFICSAESRKSITGSVNADANFEPGIIERLSPQVSLDAGRFDILELSDPQDLETTVSEIRRLATPLIDAWVARGADFKVAVDFTGGTKCMTAALVLVSRIWPCQLQYIGGTKRDKQGVGVVVDGREQVVHSNKPWDALGYQAAEEAAILFDNGDFGAASALLRRVRNDTSPGALKEAFQQFSQLVDAYHAWDRFDHRAALNALGVANRRLFFLSSLIPEMVVRRLEREIASDLRRLEELVSETQPSFSLVVDLISNALRRFHEGRFDDAAARCYRSVEAIAQFHLHKRFSISTANVEGAVIRDFVDWAWAKQGQQSPIGLQDSWELLGALERQFPDSPQHAAIFYKLGLDGPHSLLKSRNHSILAHGFDSINEKASHKLFHAALLLADLKEQDLHQFPKLR